LFESSVAAETIPFELVNRTKLICLQQSDLGLSSLSELANKGDDHYFLKSGVLLRSWRDTLAPPESSIHQIVVPASLRPQLLQIAHEIPAAGHMGVAKTQSRLLRHFFWPSIFRDTKSFCRSCDICQLLGKGKKPVPAPLWSRFLRSKALAPVAAGNVGTLPVCTASSSRTIPADVLVQFPVIDEAECRPPNSIPSSVPVVETKLSRAVGQLTPFPAHVLVQTSVSDILAGPAPTSRKDSDSVPSAAPAEPLSGVSCRAETRG